MKTTILPIVFLLSMTIAHAENGGGTRTSTARKSASPAVRNILSTQLPAKLLTTIKTKYKAYWITDLYKCSTEGRVCYYITLENADEKLKLNTVHSANWQVARVVNKDDIASR